MAGYVVSLTKEELESEPHYDLNTAPDYTDAYGKRVYEHYGVPYI